MAIEFPGVQEPGAPQQWPEKPPREQAQGYSFSVSPDGTALLFPDSDAFGTISLGLGKGRMQGLLHTRGQMKEADFFCHVPTKILLAQESL